MTPQVTEALKRGLLDGLAVAIVGFVVAGSQFFGFLLTTPAGESFAWDRAWVVAGAAFFSSLVARTVEGKFDAIRQANINAGNAKPIPADVN